MKYTSANTNTPIECVYKDVVIIGKYSMNEKLKIKHIYWNCICARREHIVYHLPAHQNKPHDDDDDENGENNNNSKRKEKRKIKMPKRNNVDGPSKKGPNVIRTHTLNVYIYEC